MTSAPSVWQCLVRLVGSVFWTLFSAYDWQSYLLPLRVRVFLICTERSNWRGPDLRWGSHLRSLCHFDNKLNNYTCFYDGLILTLRKEYKHFPVGDVAPAWHPSWDPPVCVCRRKFTFLINKPPNKIFRILRWRDGFKNFLVNSVDKKNVKHDQKKNILEANQWKLLSHRT